MSDGAYCHSSRSSRRPSDKWRPHYKGARSISSTNRSMMAATGTPARLKKTKHFSDETYGVAQRLHDILRQSETINYDLQREMRSLADSCSSEKEFCLIDDHRGINVVQRAVIKHASSILEHFVYRGFDLGLKKTCSNPLHLACQLGYSDIVSLFMGGDFDPTIRSSVCLISGEKCDECKPGGISTFILRRPYNNVQYFYTPIEISVTNDRDDILAMWLDHPIYSKYASTSNILFLACQEMASKCVGKLAIKLPRLLRHRNADGENALSVAAVKSEKCLQVLLNSGITWTDDDLYNCSPGGYSLLHRYFKSYIQCPVDITKLAFQVGSVDQFVNQRDRCGDTLLLILSRQVSRHPSLLQNTNSNSSQIREQRDQNNHEKQDQIFHTIQNLVHLGADYSVTNNIGESVLHVLLKSEGGGLMSSDFYSVLPEVNRTLEFFLSEGADVDIHNDMVATPLIWAVHALCSMESSTIEKIWPEMFYCFRLLLKHGANPNAQDEKGIGVLTFLLTVTQRWMTQCMYNMDMAKRILSYLADMLALFFQHGLRPSREILDLSTKQIATLCNINITDLRFFQGIRNLLVPFLLHGINPNALHMVCQTIDETDVPCQLHAQFYLARAFILHRQHEGVFNFFSIFENTLEQTKLNHILKSLKVILSGNFEDNDQQTSDCMTALGQITSQTRSLKSLCRITISNSLSWELGEKARCLPIPKVMINYIINI